MFDTSDEYDFTPSASSNLASLFGASMTASETAHASLTYTAPKQPRPFKEVAKTAPAKVKQESIVVCAKVVTLYKLQDNKYDVLGKHGLALTRSEPQKNHEMIIYKEKTNIITRSKITDKFQLVIQNDSFSSFIDDLSQTWLLKFETLEDRLLIFSEIQNLGGKVVDNSTAVLKDNNLQTPTKKGESAISNDEIPALKELPPDLFTPPNETKSTEDEHSDGSQSRVKADILSRMAKMGQLVMSGNGSDQTVDMSDSDTTDGKQIVKPQRKPRKLIPHRDKEMGQLHNDISRSQPVLDHSPNTAVNVAPMTHHLQPENMAVATNSVTMIQPNFLEKYLIDTRTHDTDLKLNMCEISTKLDYLIKNSSLPNQPYSSTITKEDPALNSKIKALQLQTENLNSELQRLQIKYSQLQEVNTVLEAKLKTLGETENNAHSDKQKISKLESELIQVELDLNMANTRHQSECEQYKERLENVGKELKEEKTKNIELSEKIQNPKVEDKEDNKKNKIPEIVKHRMSNLYEGILGSCGEDLSKDAGNHISCNVRNTALMIIKDLQDM